MDYRDGKYGVECTSTFCDASISVYGCIAADRGLSKKNY